MRLISLVTIAATVLVSNTADCQKDSTASNSGRHINRVWIVPVGVLASSTIDGEMREWALHSHSRSLDRLADAVNPLGTAHVLVPAMAVFYLGTVLTHETNAEHVAIETAGAYAASDAVESILKPVIGRQRP